jgi:UMF1 family MFS transporter
MFDWATSAVQTTIITAVFPIYFVKVAGAGLAESGATQRLATVNTIALVIIAIASPILGAVSDYSAVKKRFIAAFMGLGILATAALYMVNTGDIDLASWLFIAVLCGAAGSFVFYEALLPHIATPEEMDRVSSAGYALGYLGGGLLLALNLAWIQKPEWFGLSPENNLPVRLAFVSVAIWWLVFSTPSLSSAEFPSRPAASRWTSVRGRIPSGWRSFAWARRSASCAATGRRS